MLLFLLFLFLLPLSNVSSTSKCTSIHCCFHQSIRESAGFNMSNASEAKGVFQVLGVTHDCHVFYGWLHQIWNTPRLYDPVRFNLSNHDCVFRRIAYLKTQGISREMILLVDAVGRRVRLQNVMSFRSKTSRGEDIIWIKVDPRDRNEMMFTGSLDKGFDFITSFNDNYRLFIVAKSVSNIRIYELRVFIDYDNKQHAYLTRRRYDLNPILFPPLDQFLVRVVQLSESDYPMPGFTIIPSKYVYRRYINSTTVIPLVSLFMKTVRDVDLSFSSHHVIYIEKEKRFKSLANEECDSRFSYMFYQFDMKDSPLLNAFWSGFPMTTRRSLNARNAHRRMSYPHTIVRKSVLTQRKGWGEQIGVFIGFVIGIGVISFFLTCTTAMIQRELKRRSSSSSTQTH